MSGAVQVKICGIKDVVNLDAAIDCGADYIGLVFYPASPRSVSIEQARILSKRVSDRAGSKKVSRVGLFVDPDDSFLNTIIEAVSPDFIQLHGNETPERVRVVSERYKRPVIKGLAVDDAFNFNLVRPYEEAADWLLFDAKPIPGGLPGGTGQRFDWSLLKGLAFAKPWMLSGGLTPENVGEALSVLTPDAVDVSSGVESAKGVKDPDKIKAFIKAAMGFSV